MSSPLCITLTASCRLDASHRPFRLGEKEKKMITSPEFPREPVASAPLPPFRAPPLGMFLNMMNRRGQDAVPRGASPRLLGQPSSLPQASLLHASQHRHGRCCCISSVPVETSQITERDVFTPWLGRAGRRGGCCRVRNNCFWWVTQGFSYPHWIPSVR